MPNNQKYSVIQAAEMLEAPPYKVREFILSGKLTATKLNPDVKNSPLLIDGDTIEKYMEERVEK